MMSAKVNNNKVKSDPYKPNNKMFLSHTVGPYTQAGQAVKLKGLQSSCHSWLPRYKVQHLDRQKQS